MERLLTMTGAAAMILVAPLAYGEVIYENDFASHTLFGFNISIR